MTSSVQQLNKNVIYYFASTHVTIPDGNTVWKPNALCNVENEVDWDLMLKELKYIRLAN